MNAAFTSDLSVDEALLLEDVGFDACSFVMGSAFFHVGYQLGGWSRNEEMKDLTAAMRSARDIALGQLLSQTASAGAHGVVGVRLLVDHHSDHAEFVAMGTAVKARESDWSVTLGGARVPFTCSLSGQDFWALVRAGQRPHRLVVGNAVYHVAHQGLGQWLGTMGNNCELPQFTQALYDARELAMGRMQAEAEATGATGVVAVRLEEGCHGWQPHVIECLALGTSIGARGAAEHDPVQAVLTLG